MIAVVPGWGDSRSAIVFHIASTPSGQIVWGHAVDNLDHRIAVELAE